MEAHRKAFRKTLLASSISSCLLASVCVQAQENLVEEVVEKIMLTLAVGETSFTP